MHHPVHLGLQIRLVQLTDLIPDLIPAQLSLLCSAPLLSAQFALDLPASFIHLIIRFDSARHVGELGVGVGVGNQRVAVARLLVVPDGGPDLHLG